MAEALGERREGQWLAKGLTLCCRMRDRAQRLAAADATQVAILR
jgi:hypothetical protein